MRLNLRGLMFVLALSALMTSCAKSPTNPDGNPAPGGPVLVLVPNNGPVSVVKWEFWVGDPTCISGCPPPPAHMMGDGSVGEFTFGSTLNTRHYVNLLVGIPTQMGHHVKVLTWSDANYILEFNGGVPETWSTEGDSNGRGYDITRRWGFDTRRTPGTYKIVINVEDIGPSGAVTPLKAELRITIR